MQENNHTPTQATQEPSDIQNEINSIISQNPNGDNPTIPEVPLVTHNPPHNTTEKPTPQVISNQPQSETPNPYSFESKPAENEEVYKQKNNKVIYILVAVIAALAIGLGGVILRNRPAANFQDCILNQSNTIVLLEPAYCVNKKGDILFKSIEEVKKLDVQTEPNSYENITESGS